MSFYQSLHSLSYSSHSTLSRYRRRQRGPSPSPAQVHGVAVDAISTLRKVGVVGCFVGGYACKLFGSTRQPNDLDILCLNTTFTQEELKRQVVSENLRFYLVNPKDPSATYKVLWYRIADTDSCIKVDLLLPGVMSIPKIPTSSLTRRNDRGLPCAPLSLVLLLKLQAWVHHGEALEYRFRMKQPADVRDIDELLVEAGKRGVAPRKDDFLPAPFISVSLTRVRKYVIDYPSSKLAWRRLRMI